MARVTIEDCLKNVPSRFALVHMAALRVRQIREGANILVKSSKNEDAWERLEAMWDRFAKSPPPEKSALEELFRMRRERDEALLGRH